MTLTDEPTLPRPSRSTTAAVDVHGLTKHFGRRVAVDNLDLHVPTGTVAGFIGPNGAGKTTTLRMLLGLVHPTAGEGTVLGQSMDRPEGYLSKVGALIESPAFYPGLSGRANLTALGVLGGHPTGRVGGLLEQVGLGDRGEDRYRSYSLGMKQRLGIAAALLADPELLILDEPTNGLDPAGIRDMRDLLRALADSGPTVVISSHLLAELEQVADWLVVVEHGRRVYQGSVRDFMADGTASVLLRPEHPDQMGPLATLIERQGLAVRREESRLRLTFPDVSGDTDPDVNETDAVLGRLVRAAFADGIVIVEMQQGHPSLEDRYQDLVARAGADREPQR